ncbi:hypothetical protein K3495_g13484 [Podosphaera aphanis]|nr:hypothetical protein K3495_g13484 [Podosphaera aphanis]
MDDANYYMNQGLKGLRLTHSNYVEWRDVIDDYLDSQGWGNFIKKELPADSKDELKAKSAKIAVVLKAAAGSQRAYLLGLKSPKEILAKLDEFNGSPSRAKRVDDVAASLSQLQAQTGNISLEDKPTELSKKDVLLRCYGQKYQTMVQTLRIVASDYSFAQVVEKLWQAEFEGKDNKDEAALFVNGNTYGKDQKRETRKCYNCGKPGHIKPDCRKKKSDDKKKQKKVQDEKSETAGIEWIANDRFEIGTNDWCVDSGATSHMTFDKSIFVEYEEFNSTVGTAKASVNLSVVGRGKICCLLNGQNTIFGGVLHIPELHSNLLSPGKLTSTGLSVNLGAKKVVISRDNRIVATGPKIGDTWVLRSHRAAEQA